ncbi:hypothetical protein SDC9_205120 [bioreactor metagenome]|uniref:Uncharacterized protein n=1 Tax=bioreactor metagenome TaxID=1076179 RepID=A0A645J1U6_9ZZZZ
MIQLVHESDGRQPRRHRLEPLRLLDKIAKLRHLRGDGVDLEQGAVRHRRHHPDERGLADARRTVEDAARRPVRFEKRPQRRAGTKQMSLSGEFLRRPGAHSVRKGNFCDQTFAPLHEITPSRIPAGSSEDERRIPSVPAQTFAMG